MRTGSSARIKDARSPLARQNGWLAEWREHTAFRLSNGHITLLTGARNDPDLVIGDADHAMYQAKRAGKNRVQGP